MMRFFAGVLFSFFAFVALSSAMNYNHVTLPDNYAQVAASITPDPYQPVVIATPFTTYPTPQPQVVAPTTVQIVYVAFNCPDICYMKPMSEQEMLDGIGNRIVVVDLDGYAQSVMPVEAINLVESHVAYQMATATE